MKQVVNFCGMKTQIKRIGFLFAVPIGALLISCNPLSETVSKNEIGPNGSFEHIESGLPVNWLVYTANTTGSGDFSITPDSSVSKDGAQSLLFDVKSCSSKGGRFSPGVAQEIELNPGTYNVTFWVQNRGTAYSASAYGMSAKTKEEGISITSHKESNDWILESLPVTLSSASTHLRFEFNVLSAGAIRVDHLQVERVTNH